MKTNINCDLPDNCTLNISDLGIIMRVSLNISKGCAKLDKEVYKGPSRHVISITKTLSLNDITYNHMWSHYRGMITSLKLKARLLKIQVIENEISTIKREEQTRINFN